MSNSLLRRLGGAFADRTFERTQGCWNCMHFIQGPTVVDEWRRHKMAILAQRGKLLTRLGDQETGQFSGTMLETMDEVTANGMVGMCRLGKAAATFIQHNFLCTSGWSGRQGASLARAGARADAEIGELHEIAESRAKKAD